MPKIDRKLFTKKASLVADLKKIVDPKNVLAHEDEDRKIHYWNGLR